MSENMRLVTAIWPASAYIYDEQLPVDSLMLCELLKGTDFNQLFESFYELTHIPIAIIDLHANVLFSSHWQRVCTQFHRTHADTRHLCIDSDQKITSQLQAGSSHVVCHCANGLTDCASPILIEGRHVANVFIGQFFTEPADEERFAIQARTHGFDEVDYLRAVREVPIVDARQIPVILDLLARMTGIVTSLSVERKRAIEAQARHAIILDTIPQSVFWKDHHGIYLGCNKAFLRAAGLESHADITGKTDYELPWKLRATEYRTADRAVLSSAQPQLHIVEPLECADGSLRTVDTSKFPLRDASGTICGILGIYEDITEAEQAHAELLSLKEQFRATFMTGLDAFYIATLEEGRVVEVNDEFTHLMGFERAEVLGKKALDLGLYEEPSDRARIVAELKAKGFVRNRELWGRTKTGKRLRISLSIRVMQLGVGTLILGVMRDVTELWRAQRRSLSLNRLYAMLSGVNEAIARGDRPVLDEACRLAVEAGKFRMAWIGMGAPGHELVPAASAGLVDGYLTTVRITQTGERAQGPTGRCRATGEHTLCLDIATDPSMAPWRDSALARGYRSSSAFPIKVSGEVIGVFTVYGDEPSAFSADELALLDEFASDIGFALERERSEARRLAAEHAQAESEQRFRQIAEVIDEVFWMIDPISQRTLYVSPAFEKIWGQPCVAALASTEAFLTSVHPEDLARVKEAVAQKLARGDYDETYRIIRSDGSERWIHDRAFLVKNAAGEPVRIIGTATDITEHQKIEAQFRQAQKMEAIGVLAGGVAHDFNNILAVVLSYSTMLMEDLKSSDPMRADLEEIHSAARRAAELTRQLLAFSRQQVLELRLLDLNEVVAGMTKMLRRLIGEDIRLTTVLLATAAAVYADPGQLEQVLMNLVVNARDAMPGGGSLSIEISRSDLNDTEAAIVGLRAGQYVMLSVSDSGHGMDKAVQGRIFEPFFTTKPIGKGTGLGLSSVFGIIKQSGGGIGVESELGKGTTFRIWLPFAPENAGHLVQSVAVSKEPNCAGTVLLVEDDDRVRKLAQTILARRGYQVLEAQGGGDALLLCEQHKGQIDLVLTDVVMPMMSGEQLVCRLRQVRPNLPALFMSGYPDKAVGAGDLASCTSFLPKPFTPETLLRKVREALAVSKSLRP